MTAMSPESPPLEPLPLPTDTESWAGFVATYAGERLAGASRLIAELKDGESRPAADVLGLWNDIDIDLGNASSLVGLLSQVHPDEAVRTLAEVQEQEISRLATDRDLDPALFQVVAGVDDNGLEAGSARFLHRIRRDFRRSGVDRPEEIRDRLRALAERSTTLGQEFARNVIEDVRSIRVTPDRLAGLPEDFLDAHPADDDGFVTLTTEYPDVFPVRSFARDAGVRHDLVVEFLNRAWPANDAVLAELLRLRSERAHLLGYEDWPSYDAEVKMIGSGVAIREFVEQVTAMAEVPAREEFEVLLRRRQLEDPAASSLDMSDSEYYSELIRRESFNVDAQEVRRYFDFSRVRAGLLEVTGRLFGLEYRPVPGAAVWDRDVTVYDVYPADGEERLGRIYLDLHPRAGKYSHAAQFDLVGGVAGRQLPEGVLVCNFSRRLMEHDDVVTLFHEFGHLVHHVLGGHQRWLRFSGVATEWDFVEAPSQMLEEWAWDSDILRSFATDADGTPIPVDLVARMRTAKDFGRGVGARTQMFYAALSYWLHAEPPEDITAMVRDLQGRYNLFDYIDGTHLPASFGHLVGYGSGYYTYMWSLVIAKDLFSAFDPKDLFDTSVAHRYRHEILGPGGSRDAADLVARFLGRPYSLDTFAAWLRDGV
jgi:thimet oligopeptidase